MSAADDVRAARAVIESTTGMPPDTMMLPFAVVQTHNPALAAELEEDYGGTIDPMAPVLVTSEGACVLSENDWP